MIDKWIQYNCINAIDTNAEVLLRTSWSNHLAILNRCSAIDQQIFYILYAEYEHLKFKELERAIRTDAYSRVLSDKKLQSYVINRSMSPTMVSKYEEQLKIGSVLQRRLEEFVGFMNE